MMVLPLSALDQKHTLTANARMVATLGNIEPNQNTAKRIAQLRPIGDLKCHNLISQGVYRIALQQRLAFACNA